jgi:hypothetical protein
MDGGVGFPRGLSVIVNIEDLGSHNPFAPNATELFPELLPASHCHGRYAAETVCLCLGEMHRGGFAEASKKGSSGSKARRSERAR